MDFAKENADVFIGDKIDLVAAMTRTTHLGICAHQDDIEIAMYSAIAECYGQDDKWFSGVVITNGAGSPRTGIYADYSDDEMQTVRHQEQRKAAFTGDYSAMIQLMYASSEVKDPANRAVIDDIKTILTASQPEVVLLHNPADKHDTHVASMLRSITAIREMPENMRPKKVYGCEVWRDLDWLLDDEKEALDVDHYPNLAASLLGVFDSQISGGKRYDLASLGRRVANATYHASHATDESMGLTYAIDLTPLIEDTELAVTGFICGAIDRFKTDVDARITKLI